jgi:hypothetical protein
VVFSKRPEHAVSIKLRWRPRFGFSENFAESSGGRTRFRVPFEEERAETSAESLELQRLDLFLEILNSPKFFLGGPASGVQRFLLVFPLFWVPLGEPFWQVPRGY